MLDVYRQFYLLDAQPFKLSPDYHFSFGHRTYDHAKAYLKYAITEGEGIVVVTGDAGTGKTTLIATLMSEIDSRRIKMKSLNNAQLDSSNLVKRVVDIFGLPTANRSNAELLALLEHYLINYQSSGGRAVLVIDEAQGLTTELLEDLRLLSNLQDNNQLLLQLILVGQGSLMDHIRAPGMEQLQQRLIAATHLEPLEPEETSDYIRHRLGKVGWDGAPEILDEAMGLIHKFSSGIPRRINLICHRLFLRGGLEQKHKLDGQDALHVIVELHKEGLLTPVSRRDLTKRPVLVSA